MVAVVVVVAGGVSGGDNGAVQWLLTRVVVEELDVPVLVGRDGDREGRVGHHLVDLCRRGVICGQQIIKN